MGLILRFLNGNSGLLGLHHPVAARSYVEHHASYWARIRSLRKSDHHYNTYHV